MADPYIRIRGARTHNLKNVNVDLPREKLIVFTGLSGSGKSSLAFDTIFAEGQRRYVESLSAYARQFLSMMDKPDVDSIEGLSPAISIEQKTTSHNPRSTVGTVTEIYDYLRLLFARAGTPRCPTHGIDLTAQTVSQMVDQIIALPAGSKWLLLAPMFENRKGEHHKLFAKWQAQGFLRVRINGTVHEIDDLPALNPKQKHTIELVVDRFKIRDDLRLRLAESLETALRMAEGKAAVVNMDNPDERITFSARHACPECGYAIGELEPRLFSFNNPTGACPSCDGLGVKTFFDPAKVIINPELSLAAGAVRGWDRRNAYYHALLASLAVHYKFDLETPWNELPESIQDVVLNGSGKEKINFTYINPRGRPTQKRHPWEGVLPNMNRRYHETESQAVREELARYISHQTCPSCHGSRLNEAARHVFIGEQNLPEITRWSIGETYQFFLDLDLDGARGEIAAPVIREIRQRLRFLNDVGLDYLSLDRAAETLSGGEAQRIRLASQIGSGLVGVTYILDEPSIGLHQRDNDRLLATLSHLRDLGNTVIVVEHDEDAILSADYVLDIGPGAGRHGGQIVASGTPQDIIDHPKSLTGAYLSGRKKIERPERKQADANAQLVLTGARGNNLKGDTLRLPLGLLTCVTGVSGSGKSTLINDTLYQIAAQHLNRAQATASPYEAIEGLDKLDKVIDIDQSPIGRTPRSNPATYTGLFTTIRELFAGTPEARS
ncbi:MAG TPA: excinuclease ABC subunit A, partial [Halothiobacillaceae bacterium]|nr:excinuclease ABC subunit A [Halothiobacillaceae bacterium]